MTDKIKINLYAVCFGIIFLFYLTLINLKAEVNFNGDMPAANKIKEYKKSLSDFESESIPLGMIRVFVDKKHEKSIVVGKQDCSIMRNENDTYGFGFKVGGLHYGMGPEVYYQHTSGINWSWGAQLMVIELQELCTRFNTGRLAQEEYVNEVSTIINRSREYIKRKEERFKIKKDNLFREMKESIPLKSITKLHK
jgi:hypothetical protein